MGETDRIFVHLISHLLSQLWNGICKRLVTEMCSSFQQNKKQIFMMRIFWNIWGSSKEEFSNLKKEKIEPLATSRKRKNSWPKRFDWVSLTRQGTPPLTHSNGTQIASCPSCCKLLNLWTTEPIHQEDWENQQLWIDVLTSSHGYTTGLSRLTSVA